MPLISPNFDVKSIIFPQFRPVAFSQNCWEKPWKNSKNFDEMPNSVAFHFGSALLAKTKLILRERNTILIENYNLTPQYVQWPILA